MKVSTIGKIARGLGIREQMMKGMIMVIMTRGVPILGANMITCPAGLNVIRAMQLSIMRVIQPSIMRAMQPSSIRAMQLSFMRAVQPSNIGALQLNTLRAMQLSSRVMQLSHIGAM